MNALGINVLSDKWFYTKLFSAYINAPQAIQNQIEFLIHQWVRNEAFNTDLHDSVNH
jgi:hypothetical protein